MSDTAHRRHLFPDLSTQKLRHLYTDWRSIRALALLWCAGSFVIMLALASTFLLPHHGTHNSFPLWLAILLPIEVAFAFFAGVGCLGRKKWGRILGIIHCIIALGGFPLGTLIGVLGLCALFRSADLFDKPLLNVSEIKTELDYRKRAKID